jgi:hypothetical protein
LINKITALMQRRTNTVLFDPESHLTWIAGLHGVHSKVIPDVLHAGLVRLWSV